jgi:hypothetical protein
MYIDPKPNKIKRKPEERLVGKTIIVSDSISLSLFMFGSGKYKLVYMPPSIGLKISISKYKMVFILNARHIGNLE